jgi:hypothetical protein
MTEVAIQRIVVLPPWRSSQGNLTYASLFLAVCHERRLSWAVRNCTRDEGGPFEFGNQVLISSHRKPLSSKATVVNVAETSGLDLGRHG